MGVSRAQALDGIYAAALDPAGWQNALDTMSAASGGVRVHLLHAGGGSVLPECSVHSGHDPAYMATWHEYYFKINSWAPGFAGLQVGRPTRCDAVLDYRDLRRTEFFGDWLEPQGDLSSGGGLVMERSATRLTVFGGQFPRHLAERNEEAWMRDLDLYGPAMRLALDCNQAMFGLRLEAMLARRGLYAQDNPALLLLDQSGRPIFANTAAEAEVGTGRLIGLTPTARLTLRHGPAQAALQRIISDARTEHLAEFALHGAETIRILALPEDSFATLRLPPVGPGRRPAAVVLLNRRREDPTLQALLSARFGLTAAEAGIAAALTRGLTPAEIAEERGVSIHTVRNQLKTALSKTDSRRQAELAALVERLRRGGTQ